MMDKRLVKISKTLSMLLRHHPEKLGLVLDQYGRTDWKTLVRRFNAHYQMHLDRQVLQAIMAQSTKKRFALEGTTIRAVYGHSVPVMPLTPATEPPRWLYHGTSHQAATVIAKEGLLPMNRDFVHLSEDVATAQQVGARHDTHPVIYRIAARDAAKNGILFYPTSSRVWFVSELPARFLHHLTSYFRRP